SRSTRLPTGMRCGSSASRTRSTAGVPSLRSTDMGDLDIYKKQNFGNRIGFGRRSALLIVDFTVGFNDPDQFGGGNIDASIKRTVGLLQFFRDKRLPVAFTRVVYSDDGSDAGVF